MLGGWVLGAPRARRRLASRLDSASHCAKVTRSPLSTLPYATLSGYASAISGSWSVSRPAISRPASVRGLRRSPGSRPVPRQVAMADGPPAAPAPAAGTGGQTRTSAAPRPRHDAMNLTRLGCRYRAEYADFDRHRLGHFSLYWRSSRPRRRDSVGRLMDMCAAARVKHPPAATPTN